MLLLSVSVTNKLPVTVSVSILNKFCLLRMNRCRDAPVASRFFEVPLFSVQILSQFCLIFCRVAAAAIQIFFSNFSDFGRLAAVASRSIFLVLFSSCGNRNLIRAKRDLRQILCRNSVFCANCGVATGHIYPLASAATRNFGTKDKNNNENVATDVACFASWCFARVAAAATREKKICIYILPGLGRDYVAHGGLGRAPSPPRARGGAPLIPGRYVSW